jgi:carbonic anhydrase
MKSTIILISLIILSTSFKGPLNYADQSTWPGDCTKGKYQSPVAIPDDFDIEYDFEYGNKRVIIEEINYTPIQKTKIGYEHEYSLSTPALNNGGIKVRINGTLYSYKVVNVHFHLNAEHTINGTLHPMEMHIVHKNENESKSEEINQNLVLGFIFKIGSIENAFLEEIGLGTGKEVENVKIDNIVKKNEALYYYKGGLTTPPCSENVNWVVFKDIKTISENQFNRFKSFVESVNKEYAKIGNNRRIYSLNGRKIYISDSSFLKSNLSWILLLIILFI